MLDKTCLHCSKQFQVKNWRTGAKFCCKACANAGATADNNCNCATCGKAFHMKPSQKSRFPRNLGYFCSTGCAAKAKSFAYASDGNPNYKARNFDCDGYRIQPPSALRTLGHKVKRLHQAVACEALGFEKVPVGFQVHHRDCDALNNEAENLVILSNSDHRWLHKQFGNATLWAFCRGKIGLDELISWSDDRERAKRLLPLNVLMQAANDNHLL